MKSLLIVLSLLISFSAFSEELASAAIPVTGSNSSAEVGEIVSLIEYELSNPRSELSEFVDEYGEINVDMIAHMLHKVSEHAGLTQGTFVKAVQYSLPIFKNGKVNAEVFITTVENESKDYILIIIEDRPSVGFQY
jgi:hypothetical protein